MRLTPFRQPLGTGLGIRRGKSFGRNNLSVVIVVRGGFEVSQTSFDIDNWCIAAMAEWKQYLGLWCKCVDTSSPFRFGSPDDPDWIAAAQAACVSKGYKGFSSGGKMIYFIPAAITDEMCEPELEEGSSNAVYTYWRSTTGSWEFHDKLWCKHACTALPFDLAFLSNEPCVSAAKMLCELKGHRGFSHGGKNIYFIPGEISDSKCEEELEEGFNQYIYTFVRSGWHTVDAVMVTAEEPDMLIMKDAASEGPNLY